MWIAIAGAAGGLLAYLVADNPMLRFLGLACCLACVGAALALSERK